MASKMYNRARMTVTSTGTGSLSLGVAVAGYQTFSSSGAQNGDTVSYTIEDGVNWEIGTGTFSSVAGTLSRTVTQSFNGTTYGTTAISVTTNAQVYITALAADIVVNGGPLGTPSSGTMTNMTGLPLATGVTGTLPVANGGTGATTLTGLVKGNGTSAFTAATSGTDYVAPGGALGTPASGTLTNCTGLPAAGVTGLGSLASLSSINNSNWSGTQLSVSNGGTGLTSLTAGYIPFGNGTGAFGGDANHVWDNTNKRLGIGTATPSYILDISAPNDSSARLRLTNTTGYNVFWSSNTGGGIWVGTEGSAGSTLMSGTPAYASVITTTTSTPICFGIGTTEKMRLDTSGNLLIGTASSDAKIVAVTTGNVWTGRFLNSSGSGTPNGVQVVVGQNGSNLLFQVGQGTSFASVTNLFSVQGNGLVNTGAASTSPYNNTTATGANMVVSSAGDLQRSTSSLRYKTNVVDATHGLVELMLLRSVTYKGKNDGDKIFGGLIAEEVDAAGLTEFVVYDDEGKPDALHYGNMAGLFVKAIQELAAKITALEAANG